MNTINSPFEGLDKVLLYSSSQTRNTDQKAVKPKQPNAKAQKSSRKSTAKAPRSQKATASNSDQIMRARTQTRKHVRTHTNTQARTHSNVHARIQEQLKSSVLDKRHLTSFTFRFKAGELEELAKTTDKINQKSDHKMSKNDLVRLGLNWLLKDYEINKEKSLLTGVVNNA